MLFHVILVTIGVGLQLSSSAADKVTEMCAAQSDPTGLDRYTHKYEGMNHIFVLPNRTCYEQRTELTPTGGKYSFYKDGELTVAMIFNHINGDIRLRNQDNAFVVMVPLDDCDSDDFTVGFICPTEKSKLSGYAVARYGAKIPKSCITSAAKLLNDIPDSGFEVSEEELESCTEGVV